MDLRFTDEENAFREEVREFFRTELPDDIRKKMVETGHINPEEFRRWTKILHKKGWAVPHWPEEHGGTGWDSIKQYI